MDDLMAAYLDEWRNDDHKEEEPSGYAELVSLSEGARNPSNDANGSPDRNVEIEENGMNDGKEVRAAFIHSTLGEYADKEIRGMKNAGKRAHDADSDDTKGEDSTRKKQKTSSSANEDNSDDDSEEEDDMGAAESNKTLLRLWAQAHGVKSFSTCDKELLGKWTLPGAQAMSKNVTLNGEKLPDLPMDYVQPRDLDVTFDGGSRGLKLCEVIEEGNDK